LVRLGRAVVLTPRAGLRVHGDIVVFVSVHLLLKIFEPLVDRIFGILKALLQILLDDRKVICGISTSYSRG
jgi:hypothetical protein